MIAKERLLVGLHELIFVEEGMVTLFANFSKALVNLTENMEESEKKRIKKQLSILYRDSSRHREIIDSMIRQVEASKKNEY